MTSINITPYNSIKDQIFRNETEVLINKSDFIGVPFDGSTITFSFIRCNFDKLIIINIDDIEFESISINFFGCYINDLEIKTIKSNNINVSFSSCILSGIIQTQELQSVYFNNSILQNSVFLLDLNKIEISFTQENIFPLVWKRIFRKIPEKEIEEILRIKQSYHIHNHKKLVVRSNEIRKEPQGLFKQNARNPILYRLVYHLNETERKLVDVSLDIHFSQNVDDTETKILDSFLNSVSLSGYSNGIISVENCKIENWYIKEFSPQNEVNLYNIGPLNNRSKESKIEIHKSNLDKTWFDNVDFNDYKVVSFFRTKFGKATFTSCNFPSDYTSFEKFKTLENIHYPERKSENYYKNQYEIFLQLKLLLEASGNFYESQKLQSISNEALKKIDRISKWDKFILWVNSKSNNHGLSIAKPLGWFLIFSIFLYVLYLFCLGRIFNNNEVDLTLIGYYFSFIDITHRVDFLVEKEEFNSASLTIDFISKILLGFFIYQFISAFRKYGKK